MLLIKLHEDTVQYDLSEKQFASTIEAINQSGKMNIEFYTAQNGRNYGKEYLLDLYANKNTRKLSYKLVYAMAVYAMTGKISEPYTKKLQDNIYEFRGRFGSDWSRALFFHTVGNTALVVNGYTKDQDKLDPQVFAQAQRLRDEYQKCNKHKEHK